MACCPGPQQQAGGNLSEALGNLSGVLRDRFRMEMGYAVGSPDRLRTNLLQLIERLYGELERVRADRELPRP